MAWNWLFFWRQQRQTLHVVMYTRQGCHLCEDAWKQLQDNQPRFGFTLEAIDVDSHAELAAHHGNEVPVVTINGQVRFRGRINAVLLQRLLRAETGKKTGGKLEA